MLIEFRVKNFRSFRDEQIFSLVASKDKTDSQTHTIPTNISAAPALLASAAIYGPNASGKSNLIKALQYMRGVVVESASVLQPGQTFSVQPFRLDPVSATNATEFEITFLLEGTRYQYGFSMTQERIISEHLLVYKAFKPQKWFERLYDQETGKDHYEFGSGLKGPKNVWVGATRPNSLFLSMAVQLNSDVLKPIFDWFSSSLIIFNEQSPLNPQRSIQMLSQSEGSKKICAFINSADFSIVDIDVETRKVPGQTVHLDLIGGKTEVKNEVIEQQQIHFHHDTAHGKVMFDFIDESTGTRNLFFLAGPVLDILQKGLVLVVDEFDNSLHTLLVREFVQLFHRREVNTGNAQLVFTSHNTSLLNSVGLFRRDQIWIVEKDSTQSSTLTSLDEFSVRKNEAIERGYLTGRYGGVPFIHENMGMV